MAKGLAKAIDAILRDLPQDLLDLLPVLDQLLRLVLFPFMVGIVVVLGGIRLLSILHRKIFPPNGKQLHEEALAFLKKGDTTGTRREAKERLCLAIERSPDYIPSYLSLAALQLYQEENYKEALVTIELGQERFGKNKELDALHLDAKAMGSSMGHMVLAGSFAKNYLGDYSYRPLMQTSTVGLRKSKLKNNN